MRQEQDIAVTTYRESVLFFSTVPRGTFFIKRKSFKSYNSNRELPLEKQTEEESRNTANKG